MKEYRLKNGGYNIQKNLPLRFPIPAINLTKETQKRLKWFDYYYAHGENVSLTCRYFGISRATFHRWKKRYKPMNPHSLADKSKRPMKNRQSKKLREYGFLVKRIREANPTWSKYKIGAYLRNQGAVISDSTVGYILSKKNLIDLKASKKRKRARKRNRNKIRIRDVELKINEPGAIIQMDTKEYYALGEGKHIQFTAIDCFSRKRKLKGYSRKTATCAKDFLGEVIKAFPFKIKAILTDNGSEFMADFDKECQRLGIAHYWTDPSSPNQNSYVESSHCIDQKEFYEVRFIGVGIKGFNEALALWEHHYNCVRPHGSINFLTPDKFLNSVKINHMVYHMSPTKAVYCLIPTDTLKFCLNLLGKRKHFGKNH